MMNDLVGQGWAMTLFQSRDLRLMRLDIAGLKSSVADIIPNPPSAGGTTGAVGFTISADGIAWHQHDADSNHGFCPG